MSLTTFGAIMGFAAGMIQRGEEAYQSAIEKAEMRALREVFEDLLKEEKRNHSLMENTRREHVTEMILEPITGLRQEDYEINVKIPEEAKDEDLLGVAFIVEEKEMEFFNDCSGKIPLPEVARIFRKISQKKGANLIKLKNFT